MTRFTRSVRYPALEHRLTVMTKREPGSLALADRAVEVREGALMMLMRAEAELNGKTLAPRTLACAQHFFLTGRHEMSELDRYTIKKTLTITLDALKSDITIKVGDDVARTPDGTRRRGAVSLDSGDLELRKPYHNVVTTHEGVRRYGAIRIEADILRGALSAHTLIHEATHKYAGTVDWSYFRLEDLTPEDPFESKLEALENADSYAWFVSAVGGGDRTRAEIDQLIGWP